jgi:hypothetical protein
VFGSPQRLASTNDVARGSSSETASDPDRSDIGAHEGCDQLGKSSGTDRDNCLKLLDTLYITHERAILADSSEI